MRPLIQEHKEHCLKIKQCINLLPVVLSVERRSGGRGYALN